MFDKLTGLVLDVLGALGLLFAAMMIGRALFVWALEVVAAS